MISIPSVDPILCSPILFDFVLGVGGIKFKSFNKTVLVIEPVSLERDHFLLPRVKLSRATPCVLGLSSQDKVIVTFTFFFPFASTIIPLPSEVNFAVPPLVESISINALASSLSESFSLIFCPFDETSIGVFAELRLEY